MRIPYTLKAIAWQFLVVGVVVASTTLIGRSAWAPVAAFAAGLFFTLRAYLPEGLGRRFFPALLIPVLLCLCWGVALNVYQGDYSEEYGAWNAARILAYPGWWLAEWAVDLGRSLSEFFPESSMLPFYYWLDDVWLGIQSEAWESAFNDASGMFYALALHGAYLAGFAGPALLRSPGRRFDRQAVALLLCCLAAGGYLYWELDRRERLLVPARATLSEERRKSIFSELPEEHPDPYNPCYAHQPRSKVARPDVPPSLRITSGFPRLNGATAFLPVMSAVFHAVYETPPLMPGEKDEYCSETERGRFILSHFRLDTSREAYGRLVRGEDDLLVVFGPSEAQEAEAERAGVPLSFTPLGREAFVFFVHEKNAVDGLSLEQIRAIYSGQIGNWKEVGGADAPILAFQRQPNSGSRTAMDQMVMRGLSQARPLREEFAEAMNIIITLVADYRHEEPALGYSFRWYVTALFPRPDLKMLNVDGVAPTAEHIADGTYPLIRTFYAVTRQNDATPETKALVEWMAGPEGQALIAKTGYVPLH